MKKQKKKSKYDIYDDKEDAFLSGYSDATDDIIDTLIGFNALDEDFLHFVLRDFFTKHKKEWEEIL